MDFWESSTIQLSTCIIKELCQVTLLLNINNPPSIIWWQPIGLLIPQESQFSFLSDASHKCIGSWCLQFGLMWWVTKEELGTLGYSMVVTTEPLDQDTLDMIHINVLEFVALTMNIWFALAMCQHNDTVLYTQHMGNFIANNTTAISWMAHTGQTKSPHSQHLAQFLQTLLIFPLSHFIFSCITSQGHQAYCRPPLLTFESRVVGICYQQVTSRSTLLQALPHAAQSVVHTAQLHCQHWDRGNVHCKNDCTVNS